MRNKMATNGYIANNIKLMGLMPIGILMRSLPLYYVLGYYDGKNVKRMPII